MLLREARACKQFCEPRVRTDVVQPRVGLEIGKERVCGPDRPVQPLEGALLVGQAGEHDGERAGPTRRGYTRCPP